MGWLDHWLIVFCYAHVRNNGDSVSQAPSQIFWESTSGAQQLLTSFTYDYMAPAIPQAQGQFGSVYFEFDNPGMLLIQCSGGQDPTNGHGGDWARFLQ